MSIAMVNFSNLLSKHLRLFNIRGCVLSVELLSVAEIQSSLSSLSGSVVWECVEFSTEFSTGLVVTGCSLQELLSRDSELQDYGMEKWAQKQIIKENSTWNHWKF